MVNCCLKHVTHILKDIGLTVNLLYLGTCYVHPVTRGIQMKMKFKCHALFSESYIAIFFGKRPKKAPSPFQLFRKFIRFGSATLSVSPKVL